MRLGLFCCPTLVMNLLPGEARSEQVSLLGFAIAVSCGAKPLNGSDVVSQMFSKCLQYIAK